MVSHLNKSASIVLPSLDLARVYSVLAYYLTSRDTIDAYLAQHELSKTTRQELQARHSLIVAELRWCITSRHARASFVFSSMKIATGGCPRCAETDADV
jgi:hypothetical protein